jgi:tRNA (cytidine/uridine-2'-O-)-methyltransferase
MHLPPHTFKIALIHPQIAPNTGNIARLCVATGTELHLVRPLGFVLSDKELKRSAMDYWPRLKLTLHDDLDTFLQSIANTPRWYFSSKSTRSFRDADYQDGDYLIFGSETQGLPARLTEADPSRTLRIPQSPGERCLNLSTAAGIGLYEALRPRDLSGEPRVT